MAFVVKDADQRRELIMGMRSAFERGENAMAFARGFLGVSGNDPFATLIAYDHRHGYVRCLHAAALVSGAEVVEFRLFDADDDRSYPTSGVLSMLKREPISRVAEHSWRCPLTGSRLENRGDAWFAPSVGIAYPVLREIPMLHCDHAVVASGFDGT